jgi:thiamine pyrophosphokinase
MGIEPDMCVGDFDSLGFQPKGCAVVALPVEKDDTDMLACARIGLERGYREFLFFGALGGKRFSHSLAAVQTLYWLKKRGADGCIVDERCRITVAMDETVAFDESSRGSLSVFSLTDTAVVTQRGVHYPLDRYELNNAFPLGVSNNFIGEKAEITVHSGAVAIITEEKV